MRGIKYKTEEERIAASRENQKRYYAKHKEECKERSKKSRQKKLEEYRNRERAHRKQERTENPEKFRILDRKRYAKLRAEAFELLGNKCFICGSSERLIHFHKKDGQPHGNNGRQALRLVVECPNEFVSLCSAPCHRLVHWSMMYLGMIWEEIERKVKETKDAR